jgi:N-acetylneuraminate synthase/N,N'-diacetyllegionaminate synthase
MSASTDIVVAGKRLGGGDCLVIAEVGINHNGDMALARECIAAAAQAGADVVKFQNYRTEDFISDRALAISYTSRGKTITEPQYDLFKRCELSREHLGLLKQECERRHVIFASTPTSAEGVRDLVDVGVPLLKNGSDYLVHLPLIRAMGETGLPTLISTGMGTREDIDEAVRAFRATGNRQLVLLHCSSLYPAPAEQVNLARMPALAAEFGCAVGYSDHSQGTAAAIGAAALGACAIEKHFTLDRDLPGPDHHFSMDPAELAELVRQVRVVSRSLGSAQIAPAAGEWRNRDEYRLSCVAAHPLAEGQRLAAADVAFRRPGTGMRPALADRLVGRVLRHGVARGHVFTESDFA